MNRIQFPTHNNLNLLMIICDFNFVCIVLSPLKANAPLIIDPDGVLTFSISLQFLQPIARRRAQVPQGFRIVCILSFRNPACCTSAGSFLTKLR